MIGIHNVILFGTVLFVELELCVHFFHSAVWCPHFKHNLRKQIAFLPDFVASSVTLRATKHHVHIRSLANFPFTFHRVDQVIARHKHQRIVPKIPIRVPLQDCDPVELHRTVGHRFPVGIGVVD